MVPAEHGGGGKDAAWALCGAVAALVGFTGLFGGAAHYGAILAGRTKPETERATALGFFFGFGLGVLVSSGAALGYFADRLPELARTRRGQRLVPDHVD